MGEPTLRRHGAEARLAHLALATTVIAIVLTGFALAGTGPAPVVRALGGHERMGEWHRWLGLGLVACLFAAPVLAPGPLRRLVADMVFCRRGEARWWRTFPWFVLRPSRQRAPHHQGRFDPGQRLVFLLMGGSLVLLGLSGGALMLAPHSERALYAAALQLHVVVAWVLVGSAVAHALFGSGLLPSHRGVARAMFGDGRVPVSLAQRLWPAWTGRATRAMLEQMEGRQPAIAPAAPEGEGQLVSAADAGRAPAGSQGPRRRS